MPASQYVAAKVRKAVEKHVHYPFALRVANYFYERGVTIPQMQLSLETDVDICPDDIINQAKFYYNELQMGKYSNQEIPELK